MLWKILLVANSLLVVSAHGAAGIIRYYTVDGTLTSGGSAAGTVSGTLMYSTSNVYRSSFAFTVNRSGSKRDYDLYLSNEGNSYMPDFTSLIFDTPKDFIGEYDEIGLLTKGDFGSSALCTLAAPCDVTGDVSYFYSLSNSTGQRYAFGSGSLTGTAEMAITPEPSTFLLLGTGLLGAAQSLRKRSRR